MGASAPASPPPTSGLLPAGAVKLLPSSCSAPSRRRALPVELPSSPPSQGKMNANMFAALDGLDDELFFAAVRSSADGIGQNRNGAGEEKQQPLDRAPCARITFMIPQQARPPVIAPMHVNDTEVIYPPKAIRTTRDAQKGAAMRLGVLFGSDVIIYA